MTIELAVCFAVGVVIGAVIDLILGNNHKHKLLLAESKQLTEEREGDDRG